MHFSSTCINSIKPGIFASLCTNKNLVLMMRSFDRVHDGLRVAESPDQMNPIARKCGGNWSVAKTSSFPEAKLVTSSRSLPNPCLSTVSIKKKKRFPAFYFFQAWLDGQELHRCVWPGTTQLQLILVTAASATSCCLRQTSKIQIWATEQSWYVMSNQHLP